VAVLPEEYIPADGDLPEAALPPEFTSLEGEPPALAAALPEGVGGKPGLSTASKPVEHPFLAPNRGINRFAEAIPEMPPPPDMVPELPLPVWPPLPRTITGKGMVPPVALAAFLLAAGNYEMDPARVMDLVLFYTEEAALEGINHDIAFAQMCLETSFLRFGGLVLPEMNNFCGLGAIGPGQEGEYFDSPRMGVRAHIQHLHAYSGTGQLRGTLVDPRYRYVRRGSAPSIPELTGRWAVDPNYGEKILRILEQLYRFAF
jgi:hypothetical protein